MPEPHETSGNPSQQAGRLMERMFYLRDKGPPPRTLQAKERFAVARFVKARPALIEVRQDGSNGFSAEHRCYRTVASCSFFSANQTGNLETRYRFSSGVAHWGSAFALS
jgi:hypothetical protein